MEQQLQIYLIIGVFSFFIAGLILAVSLLSYYLAKLYKEKRDESAYLRYNLLDMQYIYIDSVTHACAKCVVTQFL